MQGGSRPGSGRPKGALNKKPNVIKLSIELNNPKWINEMSKQTIAQLRQRKSEVGNSLAVTVKCLELMWGLRTDSGGELSLGVQQLTELKTRLTKSSEELAAEIGEREHCFKPLALAHFEYAGFQLPAKIKAAKLRIINGESAIAGKRAALVKGGFTEAEASGMLTDYDATADLAEIADLESIAEQWRLFAEFGLAEYLPSNALEKLLVHQRYGDQPKLSKAAAMELLGISG